MGISETTRMSLASANEVILMRAQIRDIGTYARIRASRVYANGELSRRSGLISTEYGKAAHIARYASPRSVTRTPDGE